MNVSENIIGESPGIQSLLRNVRIVARTNVTVLDSDPILVRAITPPPILLSKILANKVPSRSTDCVPPTQPETTTRSGSFLAVSPVRSDLKP